MKKNLNNKGFTLVELLAVIVILAVIMVIATQQVNKAIKKSRGNAFYETVQSVRKAAQTVCAMDNKITLPTLKDNVDYSTEDIKLTIEMGTAADGTYGATVRVKAVVGGKYDNNTAPTIDSKIYKSEILAGNNELVIWFKPECPATLGW